MRTFLVKRVMKPRRTAKTRPTRVPPILTMRKDAAEEAESSQYSTGVQSSVLIPTLPS